MMDSSFIEAISEIAQNAVGVGGKVVTVPGIPKTFFVHERDGIKQHSLPMDEASTAFTIASLLEWTRSKNDIDLQEVWYSPKAVVAWSIAAAHGMASDTCTFRLPFSKQFSRLIELDKRPDGQTYSQPELWHLLRTVFPDCFPSHPNLAAQIGKVDIKKAAESTAVVKRDGVSLSRSMVAEASGANALPEVITFDIPVYEIASVSLNVDVRCAFALDAQQERFQLHVLPGEIERAYRRSEIRIASMIEEVVQQFDDLEGLKIFNGIKSLS